MTSLALNGKKFTKCGELYKMHKRYNLYKCYKFIRHEEQEVDPHFKCRFFGLIVEMSNATPPGPLFCRLPSVVKRYNSSFQINHLAKVYLDKQGKYFHYFSFDV